MGKAKGKGGREREQGKGFPYLQCAQHTARCDEALQPTRFVREFAKKRREEVACEQAPSSASAAPCTAGSGHLRLQRIEFSLNIINARLHEIFGHLGKIETVLREFPKH